MDAYLIGLHLHATAQAEDYRLRAVAPPDGDQARLAAARGFEAMGPGGRTSCSGPLWRASEPISVKMAKAQDMPLTDNRLLGNCGRLKCCLLYEFSTYQELRARLPRVNTPCQASCGGGGCMTGKVRSIRVLKQSVVVGFPDGTEAEVPLDQLTWKRRAHAQAQLEGS